MKRVLSLVVCALTALAAHGHNIYTIYPTPQNQYGFDRTATFTKQVNIVVEKEIDQTTIDRAMQVFADHGFKATISNAIAKNGSNLLLGVAGAKGTVDRHVSSLGLDRSLFALDGKYDRHLLTLTGNKRGEAQVVILGEHTDAVFYGLASLEQMLDQGTSDMQCVLIEDYADIKYRGVIEGYYGVPYSAEVTKDLFRFMARFKMNTYMYGAKSDEYHSRYWSEPYPTEITEQQRRIGFLTQDMMRDITDVAHATKVNFIWAIHPGRAFAKADNEEVLGKIMTKFESMYSLGVRQFGVFVDDVGVPTEVEEMEICARNIDELQKRIDARWNAPNTPAAEQVKPLHYVPQLYCYSWGTPQTVKNFFGSLSKTDPKINIYITGRNVWSVPSNKDIAHVKQYLGRDVSWWWNYACNDADFTKLFIMDMYTNFRDESHIDNLARLESTLNGTNTLIINPMQQGAASKIPLFSVADYAWNTDAFNNDKSWEASLPAVVGEERAVALRKAAPYLRYFDSDGLTYLFERYKLSIRRGKPDHQALLEELRAIHAACVELKKMKDSTDESDRLFYGDVRPWLLKLEAMTGEAIALFESKTPPTVDYENNPDFQFEILNGMGNHISLKVMTAEPSAECLPEMIKWLREQDEIL
ncbi:MAG: beta-N-acetylglucosaminidase domain-containing protein [Rikenellaceae bacterium]|nr:beta-N-acetylglucosaminidase domain-containing protein [Rikenellaceae bacterium]